jgi:hypothetical protein
LAWALAYASARAPGASRVLRLVLVLRVRLARDALVVSCPRGTTHLGWTDDSSDGGSCRGALFSQVVDTRFFSLQLLFFFRGVSELGVGLGLRLGLWPIGFEVRCASARLGSPCHRVMLLVVETRRKSQYLWRTLTLQGSDCGLILLGALACCTRTCYRYSTPALDRCFPQ